MQQLVSRSPGVQPLAAPSAYKRMQQATIIIIMMVMVHATSRELTSCRTATAPNTVGNCHAFARSELFEAVRRSEGTPRRP
eukprot:scaffold7757_cov390-Prasinococcus_capsulatus_cf.AAC.1